MNVVENGESSEKDLARKTYSFVRSYMEDADSRYELRSVMIQANDEDGTSWSGGCLNRKVTLADSGTLLDNGCW